MFFLHTTIDLIKKKKPFLGCLRIRFFKIFQVLLKELCLIVDDLDIWGVQKTVIFRGFEVISVSPLLSFQAICPYAQCPGLQESFQFLLLLQSCFDYKRT